MTVFQIVSICILGLGVLISVGFTLAFIVESCKKEKKGTISSVEKINNDEEVNEIDLDAMLAKLEEASKKQQNVEETKEVVEEPIKEELQEEVVEEPIKEELQEEVIEEPVVVPEITEDSISEESEPEEVLEEIEANQESVVENPQEEIKEEIVEEVVVPEEVVKEETVNKARKVSIKDLLVERKGPEFDYRVRLEKIKESQLKIDRDLDKTTRAILKYERTIRRKERNQKMLDRRALELTNLNLLMYSVTDIKNVDAEKKTRQEELTAHISELKASIQDAENYLEANKEKHDNNIKLSEYLTHEKTRYADEVKELETLIASGKYYDDNGSNGNK